jgi:hypothetical protein
MAENYREIVIKGSPKLLKGFLWGFKSGRNIRSGFIACAEREINTHHFKELLQLHGDYVHVITSVRHHRHLMAAVQRAKELDIEVVADKPVGRAYFHFKFETFSREAASRVKRLLGRPPAGVELVDYYPHEEVDDSGRGVEIYTPVHDYRLYGSGIAQGDIQKLLLLHRKLDEEEFVDVDTITIEH